MQLKKLAAPNSLITSSNIRPENLLNRPNEASATAEAEILLIDDPVEDADEGIVIVHFGPGYSAPMAPHLIGWFEELIKRELLTVLCLRKID